MRKRFLPAFLGLLLVTLTSSFAQVFIVPLPPEPAGSTTDGSELIETLGDPAGNTLYVIRYSNSLAAGQVTANPYDLLLLVSAKGTVLASKFFDNTGTRTLIGIVSFSLRRVLAQVDESGGIAIEAFRPAGGNFVSEGFVLEDDVQGLASGADVESYSVQKPPRKFLDVGFKTGNKVFQIRRYDITKLKPIPAP